MSSNKHNKLSLKIITSFALLIAVILELVGSFVPDTIYTRQNATSANGSNIEYDIGYSLWTRKVCDRLLICNKGENCRQIRINHEHPPEQPAYPICVINIYFPTSSDAIADVLVWSKKIQMPSVCLGLIGFILYEINVFMFVDCPFKNRRNITRLSCLFSVIAAIGSGISTVILSSRTMKSWKKYQLGWALALPVIGGLLQLVFGCAGYYFERHNNMDVYVDTPVKKSRTPRKIRFEDEPSIRSETELLPFEII